MLRKKPGHGRRHADDASPPHPFCSSYATPPQTLQTRPPHQTRKSHYFLLILLPVRASPTPPPLPPWPRFLRGSIEFLPLLSLPRLFFFLFFLLFLLLHWRSLYSSSSSPCYPSGTTTLRGIFSSSRMFHVRVFKGVKSVEIALWVTRCFFFFFTTSERGLVNLL